jgi:hypothetical protein
MGRAVSNCDQCPKRATTNLCDEHAAEVERVHAELRSARRELARVRRSLVTMYLADAIDIKHRFGEVQSLWDARDAIIEQIRAQLGGGR